MKTKISLLSIYYITAISLVCAQAIQTVYQLGKTISYGQVVSQLQEKRDTLSQDQLLLSKQISQISSITTLDEAEEKEFINMNRPIPVAANTNVASR